MPPTLASAREEFIRHMYRDNVVTERPRMLAVLDAVIAWSAAHPGHVRFSPDGNAKGAIRFEEVATGSAFWVATPRRHNSPLLQILPGSSRFLTAEERSAAVTSLNTHTTELNPAGRMHIGFGALKNPARREAVFQLMDELLDKVQAGRSTASVRA